jgi:hypothetical protein
MQPQAATQPVMPIILILAMLGEEETLEGFEVDAQVIVEEVRTQEGLEEGVFIAITPIRIIETTPVPRPLFILGICQAVISHVDILLQNGPVYLVHSDKRFIKKETVPIRSGWWLLSFASMMKKRFQIEIAMRHHISRPQ